MRRVVAFILKAVWGVRGAIKPPLRGCRFYSIRYRCWWVLNRVYTWSGLPKRWQMWYIK